MQLATSITKTLGIKHPVVLAPMDTVSDAKLVRAVANSGGFGVLGGGYGNEAWLQRELAALADLDKPFGVGFINWSLARQPHLLDLVLSHRPAAIWLSFGDATPFVGRVKAAGARLICQVQTEAMAREALAMGADIIVAQGSEAGGHGASRGTLALVPAVVDIAGADIPVLAAGGIADGRGMAASLMLGAAGVVLGTRLYATQEAAALEVAKQRLLQASGDETLRSSIFDIARRYAWPEPFTVRSLLNEFTQRWVGRESELRLHVDEEAELYAAARARGDINTAAVIVGEAISLIHDLPPAGTVIERLVDEAARLLRAAPGFAPA